MVVSWGEEDSVKATTFQTVAAKLANTMGRDRGVRVTFGGNAAWATPGHIHLPALPAGTILSPFEADLMSGYLDHEIGHIRRSDFDLLDSCQVELKKTPCLREIHKWIEDVWEENGTLKEYPGSERHLNTTHTFMDEQRMKQIEAAAAVGMPLTMAHLARTLTYREIWKKRGLDRDTGSDLTLEDLELGEVADLLAKEFPHCRSTKDNMELARKIHALLADAVENFEPDPSDENEESEEKSEGGGEGDGEPGEPGEPSEPGDGDPSGGGGPSGEEPGDEESGDGDGGGDGDEESPDGGAPGEPGKGKPSKGGGGTRNRKPTEAGDLEADAGKDENHELLEEIIQRIVTKNAKSDGRGKKPPKVTVVEKPANPDNLGGYVEMHWEGDDYLPPAGTEHDRIFVPSGENMSVYRRERAAMAGQVSAIKKALTIYLRSQEMKAWTRGVEEGRLDEDALADLCLTGNRRVFKQRRTRTFPNTAFAVMCDLSSSMNAKLVRLTATAFVEALAQLPRIKTMVAGFTTNEYKYEGFVGAGRTEGMDLLLFKGFDEPYRTAMPRMGAINTSGCTPLGEGYGYGFESLVKRAERRKVLLVITDGTPCYEHGPRGTVHGAEHNDFALMKHVQEKCRTYGVETLGIGIRSNSIEDFVDKAAYVKTPNDLARTVLEMTKRVVVP